jgi:hypothetical protein
MNEIENLWADHKDKVEVETVVVVVVAALHRMRVPEMTKELEVVDTYSLVLHSADGRLVVVVVEMLND